MSVCLSVYYGCASVFLFLCIRLYLSSVSLSISFSVSLLHHLLWWWDPNNYRSLDVSDGCKFEEWTDELAPRGIAAAAADDDDVDDDGWCCCWAAAADDVAMGLMELLLLQLIPSTMSDSWSRLETRTPFKDADVGPRLVAEAEWRWCWDGEEEGELQQSSYPETIEHHEQQSVHTGIVIETDRQRDRQTDRSVVCGIKQRGWKQERMEKFEAKNLPNGRTLTTNDELGTIWYRLFRYLHGVPVIVWEDRQKKT